MKEQQQRLLLQRQRSPSRSSASHLMYLPVQEMPTEEDVASPSRATRRSPCKSPSLVGHHHHHTSELLSHTSSHKKMGNWLHVRNKSLGLQKRARHMKHNTLVASFMQGPSGLLRRFHEENKSRRSQLYNYMNFSQALQSVVTRVEEIKDRKKKLQRERSRSKAQFTPILAISSDDPFNRDRRTVQADSLESSKLKLSFDSMQPSARGSGGFKETPREEALDSLRTNRAVYRHKFPENGPRFIETSLSPSDERIYRSLLMKKARQRKEGTRPPTADKENRHRRMFSETGGEQMARKGQAKRLILRSVRGEEIRLRRSIDLGRGQQRTKLLSKILGRERAQRLLQQEEQRFHYL